MRLAGDEGEGDGANHVHALQGAADGEIEQQRSMPTASVRM